MRKRTMARPWWITPRYASLPDGPRVIRSPCVLISLARFFSCYFSFCTRPQAMDDFAHTHADNMADGTSAAASDDDGENEDDEDGDNGGDRVPVRVVWTPAKTRQFLELALDEMRSSGKTPSNARLTNAQWTAVSAKMALSVKALQNRLDTVRRTWGVWTRLPTSGWVLTPTTGIDVDDRSFQAYVAAHPKNAKVVQRLRQEGFPEFDAADKFFKGRTATGSMAAAPQTQASSTGASTSTSNTPADTTSRQDNLNAAEASSSSSSEIKDARGTANNNATRAAIDRQTDLLASLVAAVSAPVEQDPPAETVVQRAVRHMHVMLDQHLEDFIRNGARVALRLASNPHLAEAFLALPSDVGILKDFCHELEDM